MVGRVRAELAPRCLPSSPTSIAATIACSRARSTKFASPSPRCARRSAPSRIAVVLGTSTSGIAAGEEAAATLAREGRMPSALPLPATRDRHGRGIRGALSCADRLALHDLDRVLVVGEGVCVGRAAARSGPLRRRDRRRCRQPLRADAERFRCARVACAGSLQSVQRQPARHQHRRRRVRVRRLAAAGRRCGLRRRRVVRRLPHLGAGPDRPRRRGRDPRRARATPALRRATSATSICTAPARRRTTRWRARSWRAFSALDVPCSSTKSLIGHTLGAAGAQELGSVLAVARRRRTSGGGCRRTVGTACATRSCRRSISSARTRSGSATCSSRTRSRSAAATPRSP